MPNFSQKLYQTAKRLIPSMGLEDGGERVDIVYSKNPDVASMNMYEQSHFHRYWYAQSIIQPHQVVGDFACGTGYGSVMLAETALTVVGADLDQRTIKKIQKRYHYVQNTEFACANLLNLKYSDTFDVLVSFETIEHFYSEDIEKLLSIYNRALKIGGKLVFSVPYRQEASPQALAMGFHKTFMIDERIIEKWMQTHGFKIDELHYQDYKTHFLVSHMEKPDFIICLAKKLVNS